MLSIPSKLDKEMLKRGSIKSQTTVGCGDAEDEGGGLEEGCICGGKKKKGTLGFRLRANTELAAFVSHVISCPSLVTGSSGY